MSCLGGGKIKGEKNKRETKWNKQGVKTMLDDWVSRV